MLDEIIYEFPNFIDAIAEVQLSNRWRLWMDY